MNMNCSNLSSYDAITTVKILPIHVHRTPFTVNVPA